jgi:hypothetical protein
VNEFKSAEILYLQNNTFIPIVNCFNYGNALIPYIIIIIIIIIIMALQPFVVPLPIFQFLDPIHSRQDSLDGGSVRCKTATYTQNTTTE